MSKRILDYDTCYQVAKQCRYKSELFKLDKGIYSKCYKTGWIYEWFPDRTPGRISQSTYIANAEIIAAAKNYDNVHDFSHHDNNMYSLAGKRKLIPSLRWLKHSDRSNINVKYTDADIINEANKYSTRHEFAIHNSSMYSRAVRRKIFSKYNILPVQPEYANRGFRDCVYVYEFVNTHVAYIGRTIYPLRRHKAHCTAGDTVYEYAHSQQMDVPPPKYIVDGILPSDGAKIECETIVKYKEAGWCLLNKKAGGSLGTIRAGINTYAHCMKVAKKFKSFGEMAKYASGVYKALKENGWYKDCTWIKYSKCPRGTWSNASKDVIVKEAAKYSTLTAFAHKSAGAYERARREWWINELFPVIHRTSPKPVLQYTKDGTFVAEFPSIKAAAIHLGTAPVNISSACAKNRKRKTACGYVFRFKSMNLDTVH